MEATDPGGKPAGRRGRRLAAVAVALLCVAVLAAVWVRRYVYASKFTPVALSPTEQEVLESKLAQLERARPLPEKTPPRRGGPLRPEPYTEEGATRKIRLTERELNGLVANTPDLAERVAIDLSDDLVSMKLVVPVDEEVPVLGGKTLRIHVGLTMNYEGDRPYIAIKGVSLGGLPLPNAWTGNLKNVNLLGELGPDDGFRRVFFAGVRTIKVRQGHLEIRLKE